MSWIPEALSREPHVTPWVGNWCFMDSSTKCLAPLIQGMLCLALHNCGVSSNTRLFVGGYSLVQQTVLSDMAPRSGHRHDYMLFIHWLLLSTWVVCWE